MDLTGKRFAIVGTAPSWRQTPWADTGLVIASLNDAYRLKGFTRADMWFDFHPMDKFYHVPAAQKQIYAHQIPVGHYVRPAQHLEWLAKQHIPVYLHPDYRTQHPPAANWPHAHPFPKAEVEAYFGHYFTSSPGWMLALALMQGARDVSVYGIHLSTEFEYVQQRPNFEFLLGRVLGASKVAVTVADGMRHYTSADGHVALPEASPVMQSKFQYAFQPRPDAHAEPIKWELHKLQVKHQRKVQALMTRPWYSPWATEVIPADSTAPERKRRVAASTLHADLVRLEVEMKDWQQQMRRVEILAGA